MPLINSRLVKNIQRKMIDFFIPRVKAIPDKIRRLFWQIVQGIYKLYVKVPRLELSIIKKSTQ